MTTYEDVVLDTGRATYPVARRTNIGEELVCGLLKEEWRELRKKDNNGTWQTAFKDDGKPRKQVVVYALVKESTMPVAQGNESHVPQRGEIIRLLFDGGAATQYIDAKKELDGQFKVGVRIKMNTHHAIRYSTNGFKEVGRLDTQDQLDAWYQSDANLRRQESVGKRGDIKMADADSDLQFKQECLQAFHEEIKDRQPDVVFDQGDPFPGPATAPASSGDKDLF